jgi:hypothetical protein
VQFLPHRVRAVSVLEGAGFAPVITDDFLLVPLPRPGESGREIRIVFRAEPAL